MRTLPALLLLGLAPSLALAERVTVGPLSFDLPEGYVRYASAPPPNIAAWKHASGAPLLGVSAAGDQPGDLDALARVLGEAEHARGIVNSLGSSVRRALTQALGLECRTAGETVEYDRERSALWIRSDATCGISGKQLLFRSQVLTFVTKDDIFMLRVDGANEQVPLVDELSARLWKTCEVAPAQRRAPTPAVPTPAKQAPDLLPKDPAPTSAPGTEGARITEPAGEH
ncbi:MAG: hypothetical protein QM767_12225 [Anaeromyxobacter sp.]